MSDKEIKARLATIRKLRRSGETLEDIGVIVGLSVPRVSTICQREGIKRETLRHSARFLARVSQVRDIYIRSMREKGYTYRQIGEVFDLNHERVRRICGVPL